MQGRSALLLAVVISGLYACGPGPGGRCGTPRSFACADAALALECRDQVWIAIPCRGPKGCLVEAGNVLCDMSLNQPGDGCPLAAEGQVTCKTPERDAILECRDGALVQTRPCPGCAGSGDRLRCG